MKLFDSHNHLQSARFGKPVAELVREMKDVGIRGCVVNATKESDWDAVRDLAEKFPNFVRPAYGIHPWYADTATAGWEEKLLKILGENPLATVGEVGVDGWVDSPMMAVQQKVFATQAGIAAATGRVMTVHCLKAWDALFEAMDQAERWPEKFLMHSFGGSIEIAERLLKRDGVMFSFSGYFLQQRKRKVLEVFKRLPKDRILLETDAPDMMPPEEFVEFLLGDEVNHPGNLGRIAEALEAEMGAQFLELIYENETAFWDL